LKIHRDRKRCHGCRACEIMCSFHHHGCIAPDASSIKVRRENSTGRVFWSVDETCDWCKGESAPWCERFCAYGALKVEP
jgi:Fe-S-cluster-containing hydrogenase component 2